MKLPFKLHIERRSEDFPNWLPIATSLGAVISAFIFSGIVLKIAGGNHSGYWVSSFQQHLEVGVSFQIRW